MDLPEVESARFVETEGAGYFNAEPEALRVLYRQRHQTFVQEIKGNSQARGSDWHLARTTDEPCDFLRGCLLARQRRP